MVGGLLASYPAGASVEYRCDEYYLLKGAQKSQCEQGRWSPPPVCLGKAENTLNVLKSLLLSTLLIRLTYNVV